MAARALDLTLTARNKGSDDEIPMAGVPHHAASAYVQRLLEQGFKVAICEQMADPSKVKGLVPREVVRVVTPGHRVRRRGARRRARTTTSSRSSGASGPAGPSASRRSTCRPASSWRAKRPTRAARSRSSCGSTRARCSSGPGRPIWSSSSRSRAAVAPSCGSSRRPSTTPRRPASSETSSGRARPRPRALPLSRAARQPAASRRPGSAKRGGPCRWRVSSSTPSARRSSSTRRRRRTSSWSSPPTAPIGARSSPRSTRRRRRPARACSAGDSWPPSRASPRSADATTRSSSSRVTPAPGASCASGSPMSATSSGSRSSSPSTGPARATSWPCAARFAALPGIVDTLARCPEPDAREALGVTASEASAGFVDPCADLHDLLARAVADEPPARASDGGVIRDGFDAVARRGARADAGRPASHRRARGPAARVVGDRGPEAPVDARLRLVHRGDPGARRQGARRLAPQADDRERRALHLRRPRRARRQAGPRRGARGGARGGALRAPRPRSRRGAGAPPRGGGAPRVVGRRERARRGGPPRRLGASGDRRLAGARARGRASPGRREAGRGGPVRPERRLARERRKGDRASGS